MVEDKVKNTSEKKSIDTKKKIELLMEKRNQLNLKIQQLEQRNKHSEKKQDTRRKILVGAYYLEQAKKNKTMDELKKIMDAYLTKDSEKILFSEF